MKMNDNEFSSEHVDIPLRCSIIPSADFLDYHENGENIKAKSTEEENMIKKIIDLKRWDTEKSSNVVSRDIRPGWTLQVRHFIG